MTFNIISFLSKIYLSFIPISLVIKAFFLIRLLKESPTNKNTKILQTLLCLIIVGLSFSDAAWTLCMANKYLLTQIPYPFFMNFSRLAWIFFIIEYQALALLLEALTKRLKFGYKNKIFFLISSAFILSFLGCMVTHFHYHPPIEHTFFKLATYYMFILCIPSVIFTLQSIKKIKAPTIIKKQLNTLIIFIICPQLLFETLQYDPHAFLLKFFSVEIPQANEFVTIAATTLMTVGLYFCINRLLGLRFLNIKKHVESGKNSFDFMKDFKVILEQFSYIRSKSELKHIVKQFFKDSFALPTNKVSLYIRSLEKNPDKQEQDETIPHQFVSTEDFLSHEYADNHAKIKDFIQKNKIIIRDEVEFSNFYEHNATYQTAIALLDTINADVFVPIYEKNRITGYIIIKKNARKTLYSAADRDEMLVLASYLSNILTLLRNRNLETMLVKEKELHEELHQKHQEINQYKQSMQHLLRTSRERTVGLILYKNKKFSFANQAAQKLIPIDLNVEQGHYISKALHQCIKNTEQYHTTQNMEITGTDNKKLRISCTPGSNEKSFIITAYCADLPELVFDAIGQLRDPSRWDYVLYLETTASGKLINAALPGTSLTLMNFKIDLLKLALMRKAVLLNIAEEDLTATVDVIHTISLGKTLHTIELEAPEKDFNVALQLFGANPLIAPDTQPPLLETLHKTGTLFIKNIELLSLETQKYLAEFLRFGAFRIFKSERKIMSNVRVICSTNQNLQELVKQGTFSEKLYYELKKTTLEFPPLLSLARSELEQLTIDFADHVLETKELKNLLQLNEQEKEHIIEQRPMSIHELKKTIHNYLQEKSKKNNVTTIAQLQPGFHAGDPLITQAARLGKHALKDKQLMITLWNKFKSQTKIATLLGVNRSSVNRRFKHYNIGS